MSTAGEAAALFGSEDAADPFNSLGALSTEAENTPAQDPFSAQSTTDLFGGSAGDDASFLTQPEPAAQPSVDYSRSNDPWTGQAAAHSAYEPQSTSYAPPPVHEAVAQNTSNGWTGQQTQWSGYEPQQYNPPATNGAYTSHSKSSSGQYAPYGSTVAPSASTTYAAHSTNHVPNAYDPPATTTSQSVYDPYKPTQPLHQQTAYNAPASQTAYPQFIDSSSSTSTVPITGPPPPARSATSNAVYRPKTSNAYDPPIPPPKQSAKRASAWPAPPSPAPYALTMSPPIRGHSQAAPLPPPPRTPSFPPPPPRTPSLPPPPSRSGSIVREYTPPPPRMPYTATTSPPPPRVASRGAVSPPHHGMNGTLPPPPPRSPAVAQNAPHHYASGPPPPAMPVAPQEDTHSHYVPFVAPSPPVESAPPPSQSLEDAYEHGRENHQEHGTLNGYHPTGYESHVLETPFEAEEEAFDSRPSYAGEEHAEPLTEPEVSTSHADDLDPESFTAADEATADVPSQSLSSETVVPSATQLSPEPLFPSHEDPEGKLVEEQFASEDPEAGSNAAMEHSRHSSSDLSSHSASSFVAAKEPTAPYDPYNPTRTVHQQAISRSHTPDRAKSPGNSSIRSYTSGKYSVDGSAPPPPASRPPLRQASKDPYAPTSYNAYDPPMVASSQRSASPSSFSVRSVGSLHSRETLARDPYAPGTSSHTSLRDRSMSNSSMFSTGTAASEDMYAPARHRQQSVGSSPYGSFTAPSILAENGPVSGLPNSHSQVLTVPATRAPYAPSPSLLGTNDPLGRTAVRVPLVSFGSGGRVVTCFHGSSALSTGFDVAMSSRASSIVHMRSLYTAIPQSALDSSAATHPGPLFSDPGTPATTLVRTGAATQTKNKKARVIKYLEERVEETTSGIGYLHRGSVESYRAQAKLVMIKLLKVMVENDGRLSGSAEIDSAVRSTLIPDLPTSVDASTDGLHVPAATSYASLGGALHDPNDAVVATHTLRASQLDKIQKFLLRGDRRTAYQYAADEKLWAHAMVIASSVDKEAWREVVTEFLRAELSPHEGSGLSDSKAAAAVRGREPLKVAYSLFAGGGPAAVQELAPVKPLTAQLQALPIPTPTPVVGSVTPLTASFAQPLHMAPLSAEVLAKWPETVAMILNSAMTTESFSALSALGDQLAANNWHEAAHVCYLLSPQTSLWGGLGMPGTRLVLYGASSPKVPSTFWKDPDPIIFSEIVEFALSLTPPAKGQEAFPGVPHLQAYKLIRAANLTELGHIELANRYCEAISSSLSRGSPYLNITFGEQLQGLTDRLTAAPVLDKSGSWISSKMARPSLDKLGGWLENRFASFIAGEGDSPRPEDTDGKKQTFSGPFAHYSTISSTTTSTIPSPQMSSSNLTEVPTAPPFRTGSAMALRPPPSAAPAQIARASSAMDYLRRKPSPVPRSASAITSPFGNAPQTNTQEYSPYGYGYTPETTPREDQEGPETPSGPQLASWWGDSSAPTPTATSFVNPGVPASASNEGFVSLMDTPAVVATPSLTNGSAISSSSSRLDAFDDDDDLGLGNSASRAKASSEAQQETPGAKPAAESEKAQPAKEAEKPGEASNGGWFSRLWKRDAAAPVKANLGDQSAFYYDKEQKRWVNKNAPAEAAAPSPPPPPPRAQTASPASAAGRPPLASPGVPPPRPSTAIDLTDGPPKKPPMRVRSNLVPSEVASAPNTPAPPRTPMANSMDPPGLDGPPTGSFRPRSAAKRPARNRYVDVFQQEAAS